MAPSRHLVLALALVGTMMMAGCNVKDWYNQQGTVTVELAVQGPQDTLLDHFRSVKVAIYGVVVRQVNIADAKQFSFGNDPLIVDLVEKGRAGERVPLAEFKTSLRATERVTIRMQVIEAIEAGGTPMEVCRETDRPERFPCFFQPSNSAWVYEDKPFAPPRGGQVVVGFPIAVKFAQQGRVTEYYLEADPNRIVLENHR